MARQFSPALSGRRLSVEPYLGIYFGPLVAATAVMKEGCCWIDDGGNGDVLWEYEWSDRGGCVCARGCENEKPF